MQKYTNDIATVVGGALTPLSNATCTVYFSGTLTLASLFSDNGVTPLANPTTSSATGQLAFYAADGRYDIVVTKANYATTTITDVLLEDPAQGQDLFYLPGGTGALSRTIQGKLRETVSPTDFGAVGNGVANDTAAVLAALQSGAVVDGGGLTYAIAGTMQPTSFKGLRNANFVQLTQTPPSYNAAVGPDQSIATLSIYNLSNWFIDNCVFNMGTTTNTGIFSNTYFDNNNCALRVTNVNGTYNENFRITNCTVYGYGMGSRIAVRRSKRFVVENCLVRDGLAGSTPDPTDDMIVGFEVWDCANFTVANCNVYTLQTIVSGVPTTRWTRGFMFFETRDCTVVGCNSTATDQGYDWTGTIDTSIFPAYYEGNRRFTQSACTANNSGTWGFKFANVTHDGLVTGCIANNNGSGGFVFSGSGSAIPPIAYVTNNIDVVGCKVVNCLGTGGAGVGWARAFRLMAGSAAVGTAPNTMDTYPRAIRFRACEAIDNQAVPTTTLGFQSDVVQIEPTTAGYNTNIASTVVACSVSSNITSAFQNLGPNFCWVTDSGTQSIPNAAYTTVNWGNSNLDYQGLHSATTNNSNIYIKEPGVYRITSLVNFAANATGARIVRLAKNGAFYDRSTVTQVNSSASIATAIMTSMIDNVSAGTYFSVEVYQNSGGALNLIGNQSYFSIEQV